MGLIISCTRSPHAMEMMTDTIKMVHLDGSVKEYLPPLSAKDVLLQHPRHFIFNARDLQSCNPRPVLGRQELLQGHIYFIVPLAALQSQDLVSLASKLVVAANKHSSSLAPLEKEDADETSNSKEYLEEFLGKTRPEDEDKRMGICDTPQLKMAYINHLLSKSQSSSWRPGLHTIEESCLAF